MPRSIPDSVTVITGASSGIGRATALELARRNGTVVIAARREAALEDLARECEALGGHPLPVPTDVNDEQAMHALARRTVENFGRVDTWINNAAVTLFGRFEETPAADYRRVIETNLFGYINGARAAIPWFREQGSGVLINVASVAGRVAQPFTSAYVASKAAVIGLSECLRQELRDAPGVHVVTMLLPSVDTPLFQHGANHMGRAVKPLEPVHDPRRIARSIVSAIVKPQREVAVGAAAQVALLAQRVAPGTLEQLAARTVARQHFQDRPAEPGVGNLYEPIGPYAVRGGWRRPSPRPAAAWIAAAGLAGLGLGFGLARLRGQRR